MHRIYMCVLVYAPNPYTYMRQLKPVVSHKDRHRKSVLQNSSQLPEWRNMCHNKKKCMPICIIQRSVPKSAILMLALARQIL